MTTTSHKPTTILTGFLGSGKTTYLNHVLQKNADTRFAIIENEYGEQSIDSELILRAEDDIVELNNGCLCCTLNENLYDILNKLYQRRDQYDEVIIEATGIADPRGLAAPFLSNAPIKKQFPLTRIICLVDAALVESQLEETTEAIHQITYSDVLLINKIDQVTENYIDELIKKLKRLNPLAQIVCGQEGYFPDIDHITHDSQLDSIETGKCSSTVMEQQNSHHHHHHHHTDGIASHTLIFDQPFDYQKLHLRVLTFLTFQAKGLYRMKGIVDFVGSDQRYVLQSVGPRMAIDAQRPWGSDEKRQSKIVIIGKNYKKERLEQMFAQCFANSVETNK